MSTPRRPAAFRVDPSEREERQAATSRTGRAPGAAPAQEAVVTPEPVDIFDEPDAAFEEPPPATPPRRRSWAGRIFLTALGILVSLAIGLWTDRLIRDLFEQAGWLGWAALAIAGTAALALLVILLREAWALTRLASIEKLHARALDAVARDDAKLARSLVDDLTALLSGRPETAAGRHALAALRNDVIDGADLMRLAETELLAPLDARAERLVLDAAKRVSLVTAVSPRALVDLAYVVFEAGRLIRRLAELYGGRPGTLGFFRLSRNVLAHLAVTGSVAMSDSIVQQIVGHGLATRLSARLGEGVVNGMMTARIGIAAMETARPLPFRAVKRPGMGDFLSALAAFARKEGTVRQAD